MNLEIFKFLWALIGFIALLVTIPGTIELLILTIGAILPPRKSVESKTTSFRMAVVIPAHNESANIETCLKSLFDCRDKESEIVVVADNCTDNTAEVAGKNGARVLIRTNETERGKGFALDFAFTELLKESFDGFLIIDADTVVDSNLLAEFRRLFLAGADAVQCRYTVANTDSSVRTRLMNLALLAFNVLRPRGRDHWGLSCGIYGNGFGLRAEILHAVPYSARSVVEDLEYHLELVRKGFKVIFADKTGVKGEMPASGSGVKTQRSRWEGGRLRMLVNFAPQLFIEVCKGKFRLLEPLLDLLLLPLAFHISLILIAALQFDSSLQVLGLFSFFVVILHIFSAVFVGKGGWKDLAVLAYAPFYILWKITLLKSLFKTSQGDAQWIRTERANSGEKL
ncbi:MAG: glycosyltransferase family 2 protein [Pyrinomonadaceae bacterium]|nr:glycosyltransferase family 2 protein [Pyrinomonadaceae bacterium]